MAARNLPEPVYERLDSGLRAIRSRLPGRPPKSVVETGEIPEFDLEDFRADADDLDGSLDLMAVCSRTEPSDQSA